MILIAITLIAAIAIAGFVFGLFGSFTSTAQVSATVTSCTDVGANQPEVCVISAQNTCSSNTAANACSVTVLGVTHAGTLTASPVTIGAGAGQVPFCSSVMMTAAATRMRGTVVVTI